MCNGKGSQSFGVNNFLDAPGFSPEILSRSVLRRNREVPKVPVVFYYAHVFDMGDYTITKLTPAGSDFGISWVVSSERDILI